MDALKQPTVVVFCGWPTSGKTTIARQIAEVLSLRIIDSDDVRRLTVGSVDPDWDKTEESRRRNSREFGLLVYDVIHRIVAGYCALGRSLIVTAPYTSAAGWTFLQAAMGDYPDAVLKVVWCRPSDVSQASVERRLRERNAGGYQGGSFDYGKVAASMSAFAPVPLPHFKLDTSAEGPAECGRKALEYILATP